MLVLLIVLALCAAPLARVSPSPRVAAAARPLTWRCPLARPSIVPTRQAPFGACGDTQGLIRFAGSRCSRIGDSERQPSARCAQSPFPHGLTACYSCVPALATAALRYHTAAQLCPSADNAAGGRCTPQRTPHAVASSRACTRASSHGSWNTRSNSGSRRGACSIEGRQDVGHRCRKRPR